MIPAIQIDQVHKSFGAFEALKGVDLTIEQGEFFALLGPNGAGKSTLISLLAGLLRPTSGTLRVMGHDVVKDYQQARRLLGVVPQELVFDPFFNVREMLRFQAGYFGLGRENDAWVDEVIEGLGLTDKAHTNMRRLSGGMKRRALIAQALAHKPPVVVLDEPTAGVDVELRRDMWRQIGALRDKGTTIILTTHYIEEAQEMADRVGVINKGRLLLVDDKAAIMAQLGRTEARITLTSPVSALPASLEGYPVALEDDGRSIVYRGGDGKGKREAAEVIKAVVAAGLGFDGIVTRESTLEDIFVDLVEGREGVPA